MEAQKIKDIRGKILKKLRKQGYLTEYEEAYLERWVVEFGYSFEIIELALKRTTSARNPSFEYINKILISWHEKGYKTKEEILSAEENKSTADVGKAKPRTGTAPQKGNFEQRKYTDEDFEKLYTDV